MDCYNCGKAIIGDSTCSEDGFVFCDTICRYDWRKKGKPIRGSEERRQTNPLILTEQDMTYAVPVPGFEGRTLCVRTSPCVGTHLYLDGKRIKCTSRKLFRRKHNYLVKDNKGNTVQIELQLKGVDIIPLVKANGIKYQLANPLSVWQNIWIGIPLLLIFIGGALGGAIGGSAVYFNAILMRKIRHSIPRYLISGATILLAFVFFLQASLFLAPHLEYLSLKLSHSPQKSRTLDILTSKVWTCKRFQDLQGNDITNPADPALGARRYFKGNGDFSQVFSNGGTISGKWQFDSLNGILNVQVDTLRTVLNIVEITSSTLQLKYGNAIIVHKSD